MILLVNRREEQPAGEEPMKSLRGSSWLEEESGLASACCTEVFPGLVRARLGLSSFVGWMSAGPRSGSNRKLTKWIGCKKKKRKNGDVPR